VAAREAGGEERQVSERGGCCKEINNIKQTLTVASSDDVGGSWLWRHGKLAATRREASVRDGGLAAKK